MPWPGPLPRYAPTGRGPASAVLARRSLARAAGEPAALADVRVASPWPYAALPWPYAALPWPYAALPWPYALPWTALPCDGTWRSVRLWPLRSHPYSAARRAPTSAQTKPGNTNTGVPAPILPPGGDVRARTDNFRPTVAKRVCLERARTGTRTGRAQLALGRRVMARDATGARRRGRPLGEVGGRTRRG